MNRGLVCAVVLIGAVCQGNRGHADPLTLRMAAIAPRGSAFERELEAFARAVRAATAEKVQIKWYPGGIAGDERRAIDRVRSRQLDGAAGTLMCQELSPTLRSTRVIGLFDSQEEASYVLGRLRPSIDRELSQAGLVNLGVATFGPDLVFSRRPISSLNDLRQQRLAVGDLDEVLCAELTALGLHVTLSPFARALTAYESAPGAASAADRPDGFIAPAATALAFQWLGAARYFTRLHLGITPVCLVMATSSFDSLPLDAQEALRSAAAKLLLRLHDVAYAEDKLPLEQLFASRGMREVPVSARFAAELASVAATVRSSLSEALISRRLLDRVQELAAEYRAESRKVRLPQGMRSPIGGR